MKKYLLVQWCYYYPDGGLDNIRYQFDDLEEALKQFDSDVNISKSRELSGYDHHELVDRDTLNVIKSYRR